MAEDGEPKKLQPEDIRFLALEGGGGKGFAFLGAIQVLENIEGRNVMNQVEGVSGTSAGAITALMLSLGMTSAEIEKELDETDFDLFFDPPNRWLPRPGVFVEQERNDCELSMLKGWSPAELLVGAAMAPGRAVVGAVLGAGVPGVGAARGALAAAGGTTFMCLLARDTALGKVLLSLAWLLSPKSRFKEMILKAFRDWAVAKAPEAKAIVDRLVGKQETQVDEENLPRYLMFLDRDMGLFSGQAARDYFEGLIQKRLGQKLGAQMANRISSLTFVQCRMLNQRHKLGFRDLLVCGANLSIGRSVLFSWKHTPNFPIADAVRISMSLPIAYKPYIISEDIDGYPPCGTYVDGGLWNNLPFREIGALAASSAAKQRLVSAAVAERSTLGLRLEIVPPERVLTAEAVILKSFAVAGETQILPDLDPFIQILDTRGLSTLQFSPPKGVREKVTKRSRRAMYRYFGKEPLDEDEDEEDDRESEALRSESLCVTYEGEGSPLRPARSWR
jgi:predicted acylesterase/phospholipase RssA